MHTFDIKRQLVSEAVGTAMLVCAVVGSGIMADNLTDDVALALLANTLATGAALVVLISILGPISGAHLNPAVTLVMVLRRAQGAVEGAWYALAQIVGLLRFLGDFAQRNNRVLVIVAVNRQRRASGDFAGTVRGKHNQFEPVRNLVNAIFDRNAGHEKLQSSAEKPETAIYAQNAGMTSGHSASERPDFGFFSLWQCRGHLGNRCSEDRMPPVRGYVAQGNQHEPPVLKPRMGQDQLVRCGNFLFGQVEADPVAHCGVVRNDLIFIGQKVDVQSSRLPAFCALSPEICLDLMQ